MASNSFENKNITNWRDLDGNLYNNHFNNGQCYISVSFNRSVNSSEANYRCNIPVYPTEISFNNKTTYTSGEILGRPGTIAGYVTTGDTSTSISLHLHRELKINTTNSQIKHTDINKIDELISLMQSCLYPKRFSDSIAVPIVTYCFGKVIITGKQTGFNCKWEGPKIGNMYMECTVNAEVTHVPVGIKYFDDMYTGKPYVFD